MSGFIIPTSFAEYLVKNILAKTKNFRVIFPNLSRDNKRYFPDGEIYMKILKANRFRRRKVIILHTGAPKPNEGLMELELILQILRDAHIRSEVFFTYFPYSMQDKVFEKGETNVAENLIEKLINYYKVKKIYTIDAHFWGRKWVKKYPILNISATSIMIEKAKKDFGKDILIPSKTRDQSSAEGRFLFFSPDMGGKRRTGISGMKKKRLNSFNVKILSQKLNTKGKIVAAVDDVIRTGTTLLGFYGVAKKAGAKKVIALITHGVMPAGVSKTKKIYSKLYLTNTIAQKEANIDITDLILRNIS